MMIRRAYAEEAVTYTLDQCLQAGLEHSVTAANARREQAISDAVITQARAQALPNLTATASYTRMDELQEMDFGGQLVPVGSLDNYSASTEIRQVLYSGGKVRAALRAARLTSRRADLLRKEAEASVARDIRKGFYDVRHAGDAVLVQEQSLIRMQAVLADTETRFKSGKASDFDVLQVKVRVAQSALPLMAARNAYELGLESFKRLVGIDEPRLELAGELRAVPFEADVDRLTGVAMEGRAWLRLLEATLGLKAQDVAAAGAESYPQLDLVAAYQGADPYGYGASDGGWQWHWNAGMSLRWSLWDGGMTRGTVRQKRLELEQMKAEVEDAKRAVRLEVRSACLGLSHASETLATAVEAVSLARRALDIAEAKHRSGLATLLEVTEANVLLQTAELARSGALRDHLKARADLAYATGQDDLAGDNKP
jgi:HAE1 family hydrophobic/amphiphilic exporter-1